MAINATNSGTPRQLIPAGNYVARCYQMLHIGTVKELILGEEKILNKVRIGWELPTEQRVFNEEKGLQPCVISKEFTLSMNEKSNLRKVLASWRGKDFSEDEAKSFDISKLLTVPCMLNLIHKPSKDGSKVYEEIGSISPLPKGFECPAQINPTMLLDYDTFDYHLYMTLPDFIKTKIQGSLEFAAMEKPEEKHIDTPHEFDPDKSDLTDTANDLPF